MDLSDNGSTVKPVSFMDNDSKKVVYENEKNDKYMWDFVNYCRDQGDLAYVKWNDPPEKTNGDIIVFLDNYN